MTEKQFEELTNLYLDNEIGRHELGELKDAIRHNVLRRRKFERACELHQAARKALAARAGGATTTSDPATGNGPTASFIPVDIPSALSARSVAPTRNDPVLPARPTTVRQKQTQAHRNASVATLAERQMNRGAAHEVKLDKINLEARRADTSASAPQSFSFFNSPVGMLMGAFFTTLAALGLFLLLKAATGDVNEDGTSRDTVPILARSDVTIDQKVLSQLTADQKRKSATDDAARAHIYQAAMTGQPAANIPAANENSASAIPESVARTSADLALTVLPNSGASNLTPESILNAQAAGGGLAPGSDQWVKLSMPTMVPAAPTLDDKNKPVNSTTMPVALP